MSWSYSRDLGGIAVEVKGSEPDLLPQLDLDFDGFPPLESEGLKRVRFTAHGQRYLPPPGLPQTFRGRFGVCFDQGPLRHIWYPGPVWVVYDFERDCGDVYSENPELLYERLYLSILSRVGELLETRGLHRIHGLALSSPFGTCLFLMRSGVGKSALGHALLQREGWRLLSEDTPLLDRQGRLHPFPFRLGLREPGGGTDKRLVRASTFAIDRLSSPCSYIFSGAWCTGEEPMLAPLSRARLAGLLLRDGVVGLGVPQVVELFLRPGAREMLGKAGLLAGRLRAILPLLRAPAHTLYLTPRETRNADFLERWLSHSAPASG